MVVLTRLGPPEDGIQHAEAGTTVYVNDKSLGAGKLYISEARVSWVGDQEQGFSLEYPHIAIHAIHKNAAEFPHPNLYCIIDVRLVDSDGTPTPESSRHGSDDEDDGGGDDEGGITEIRFVPANEASLQAMFDAMSKCQSLHPDPTDSNDEDEEVEGEEEEGMYDDAEEEGDGEGAEEDDGDGRPSNGGGGTEEPMDQ